MSVTSRNSSSTEILVSVEGKPLYPSYVISEFVLNITDGDTGVVLQHNIRITNINGNNTTINLHRINVSLNNLLVIPECFSIVVLATALSQEYGESEPSITEIQIPAGKTIHLTTKLINIHMSEIYTVLILVYGIWH